MGAIRTVTPSTYPEPYRRLAEVGQVPATRFRYSRHPDGWADLRVPAGDGPHPVAILVHGGFWRMPWGADLMHAVASHLQRNGWATWNIEYRRVGVAGGGWPGTFLDVAAAVDALASLSPPTLRLRSTVAIGHSAGGQLALWLAARNALPPGAPGANPRLVPSAVIGLAPISDLVAAAALGLGHDAAQELLGAGPEEDHDRYALASPRSRLPLGVPQLLIHGTEDPCVPVSMTEDYATAASAAGDSVEFVGLRAGHAEMIDPASPAWTAVGQRLSQLCCLDPNTEKGDQREVLGNLEAVAI